MPIVTHEFDNQVAAVRAMDDALEGIRVESGEMEEYLAKQKELYKQIADAALPLFEAMGASIVDASTGWEKFKEAAKDAIATILLAYAKEEAVLGIKAIAKALGGDVLAAAEIGGHVAAAAAAAAGAGFVQTLAEGGIVTRPTFALVGERGPEAVVPLKHSGGMGNVMIVNVYGNLLTERQLVDGILRRAVSHARAY